MNKWIIVAAQSRSTEENCVYQIIILMTHFFILFFKEDISRSEVLLLKSWQHWEYTEEGQTERCNQTKVPEWSWTRDVAVQCLHMNHVAATASFIPFLSNNRYSWLQNISYEQIVLEVVLLRVHDDSTERCHLDCQSESLWVYRVIIRLILGTFLDKIMLQECSKCWFLTIDDLFYVSLLMTCRKQLLDPL